MSSKLFRVFQSEEGQVYLSAKDLYDELGAGSPPTYQAFLDCLRLMFEVDTSFKSLFTTETYTKKSGKVGKRFYVSEFIAFYVATVYSNYVLAVSIAEGGKNAE